MLDNKGADSFLETTFGADRHLNGYDFPHGRAAGPARCPYRRAWGRGFGPVLRAKRSDRLGYSGCGNDDGYHLRGHSRGGVVSQTKDRHTEKRSCSCDRQRSGAKPPCGSRRVRSCLEPRRDRAVVLRLTDGCRAVGERDQHTGKCYFTDAEQGRWVWQRARRHRDAAWTYPPCCAPCRRCQFPLAP